MRRTRQRSAILEELRKVKTHPTAEEVHEMVRRRLPRISLGTVYRNLEALSAAGTIRKLATAGSRKRFDADSRNHYHLRCVGCGRVVDLELSVEERLNEEAARSTGYRVLGHELEFQGWCPDCLDAAGEEHE
ncbi:MAG TPA: transcriptional repressor [bacterium]|nr:transcriptional repressor [bacterium]